MSNVISPMEVCLALTVLKEKQLIYKDKIESAGFYNLSDADVNTCKRRIKELQNTMNLLADIGGVERDDDQGKIDENFAFENIASGWTIDKNISYITEEELLTIRDITARVSMHLYKGKTNYSIYLATKKRGTTIKQLEVKTEDSEFANKLAYFAQIVIDSVADFVKKKTLEVKNGEAEN